MIINEGLTIEEIKDKITYLNMKIRISILKNGTTFFCKNRIKRVELLKTYIN